jgi:hypothetical protein
MLVTLRPLVTELYYFDDRSFNHILRALPDLYYDEVLVYFGHSSDCGFSNAIFISLSESLLLQTLLGEDEIPVVMFLRIRLGDEPWS